MEQAIRDAGNEALKLHVSALMNSVVGPQQMLVHEAQAVRESLSRADQLMRVALWRWLTSVEIRQRVQAALDDLIKEWEGKHGRPIETD